MATPVVLKALLDLSDGTTFNETSADCYDISDIVITANTRRGRSRELDKIESGYAVITVIDDNGNFNPDNSASPYYGKLKPGNKLRLYPMYNDGTGDLRYQNIFTGYIFNYGTRFSMGVDSANKIVIEAYDAFKIFNSVSITEVTNSTTGDSSDERIGQILDEISWPAGLRSFETSTLSLADDQGNLRTVLDAIRQVEDTEAGLVFVDGSGVVQFKNRETVNLPPDIASAYFFSDLGNGTTYNDLRLTQNDELLINRITVRSYDGTNAVTVYDSTSETDYFSRSAERADVLLTSTTDLTALGNQLLENYKDPSLQIDRIILNLAEYEVIDRVIAGLYFDIFDIPVWIEKALAGNSTLSRLGWIQGVNHDITKNTWLATAFTGISEEYGDTQFYFSSFQRNSTSALTGYIVDLVPAGNDAVFIGVDQTTPSKGMIGLYSKTRELSETYNFSVSGQGLTPVQFIEDNNGKYFSIGNIDTTTDSGYYILHSIDFASTDFAYKLYDSTPYELSMTECYVDATGDYYVGGTHVAPAWSTTLHSTNPAAFVAKISADGDTILWQKRIRYKSIYKDYIFPVGIYEADTYVYAVFAYYPTLTANGKVRIVKFSATNGAVAETIAINDTARWTIAATDSIKDNDGNIYIVDQVQKLFGSGIADPLVLYKLSPTLTSIWTRTLSAPPPSYLTSTFVLPRLLCDSNNNIYILIFVAGSTSNNTHIFKYDTNGNLLYSRRLNLATGAGYPGANWQNGVTRAIIANDNDNLYFAGDIGNGAPIYSGLRVPTIAHLSGAGTIVSTQSYTLDLSTTYTPAYSYTSTSPITGTSGTVSFTMTTDTYLEFADDGLAIEALTVTVTSETYTESGVTFN